MPKLKALVFKYCTDEKNTYCSKGLRVEWREGRTHVKRCGFEVLHYRPHLPFIPAHIFNNSSPHHIIKPRSNYLHPRTSHPLPQPCQPPPTQPHHQPSPKWESPQDSSPCTTSSTLPYHYHSSSSYTHVTDGHQNRSYTERDSHPISP